MNLHLESFTTSLVDVWALYDSEGRTLGWKWNWTTYLSTGTDSGVNDLLCTLVDEAMIVCLEADTDLETFGFVCHLDYILSLQPRNLGYYLDGASTSCRGNLILYAFYYASVEAFCQLANIYLITIYIANTIDKTTIS